VENVLKNVGNAQDVLNYNISQIVKKVSAKSILYLALSSVRMFTVCKMMKQSTGCLKMIIVTFFLQESMSFIDCQLKIFQAFVSWANQTVYICLYKYSSCQLFEWLITLLCCILCQITERMGRCGPVAAAFERSEDLLCKHLVGSLVRALSASFSFL